MKTLVLLALGWSASTFAGTVSSVVSIAGVPGSTVLVPIRLMTDSNVTAGQFDLIYQTNYLMAGSAGFDDLGASSSGARFYRAKVAP